MLPAHVQITVTASSSARRFVSRIIFAARFLHVMDTPEAAEPVAAPAAGAVTAADDTTGAVEMMYEYAVDMVCEKCSEAVHKALDGTADVTSVTTNVQAQLVVVEGSFAPAVIVEKLEKVGRKVRLIGSGCATAVEKGVFVVPAAVGRSGENSAGALSAPAPALS